MFRHAPELQNSSGVAGLGGFHSLFGHSLRLMNGPKHFHRGRCRLLLHDRALLRGGITHYVKCVAATAALM